MPNEREIQLLTFVGVFNPADVSFALTAQHLREIESAIGEVVQGGEAITERGPGRIVTIPRNQIDLLIENERIEVRRRFPGPSIQEASDQMARLFSVSLETVEVDPSEVSWLRIGYNFVMTIQTDGSAIARLANGVFSEDFTAHLGYPIKGAATWLWLQAKDTLLWLKLEPFRNDPAASRITVTANFLEEPGTLPPIEADDSKISNYLTELNELLNRIGL